MTKNNQHMDELEMLRKKIIELEQNNYLYKVTEET